MIFRPTIDPRHIAGVIDSDGSISISKRNISRNRPTYTVLVQLTWVLTADSKTYIETLVRYFGGSYFISAKRHNGRFENAKPVIKYCATGKAAEKLLNAVCGYLWLKQEQAQNALQTLAYKKLDFRVRTEEDYLRFDRLYLSNKELNSGKKANSI